MFFKKIRTKKENSPPTDYYEQAKDWRTEIFDTQRVWLHRCILGLFILSILFALSLIANLALLPLKQTVPFLYTLNETTGELTQLNTYQPNEFKQDWLMTRFLLVRFIVNRESYDSDDLDQPYQIAWAMSDTEIANDYMNDVGTDNPKSPYCIYGKTKYVTVHVLSVNQLNEETAAVRFEQTIHNRDQDSNTTIQKEAIIKWKYTIPDTTEKMLDRDPLGFKITYYQPTQVNLDTE